MAMDVVDEEGEEEVEERGMEEEAEEEEGRLGGVQEVEKLLGKRMYRKEQAVSGAMEGRMTSGWRANSRSRWM